MNVALLSSTPLQGCCLAVGGYSRRDLMLSRRLKWMLNYAIQTATCQCCFPLLADNTNLESVTEPFANAKSFVRGEHALLLLLLFGGG